MKVLPKNMGDSQISNIIAAQAKKGFWDGGSHTSYFDECRFHVLKYNALAIFTRDVGYHTCGWWKNPDYERCYHLSLSFVDQFGNRLPHNKKTAEKFVKMLYGYSRNMVWCAPPHSDDGLKYSVWHYRLFCDEGWQAIKPRGEVYSKQFTEVGWKSFSELKNLN